MSTQPDPELLQHIAAMAAANEDAAAPSSAIAVLIDELVAVRDTLDATKEMLRTTQARYDELRKRLIPDALAAAGLVDDTGRGSVSHRSGAKVTLRRDFYASVAAGNEDALKAWLREHGHEDLIREVVHPQTLRSFCRERVEDGAALPPGVSTYVETTAVITGRKGAAQ